MFMVHTLGNAALRAAPKLPLIALVSKVFVKFLTSTGIRARRLWMYW